MLSLPALTLASLLFTPHSNAQQRTDEVYDYIVVGSGPGGAPVASKLAQSGFSVLLMDAGDDQRQNTNTSIAVVLADVAAEDEALRWDYFVRYHEDDEVAYSNRYFTWLTPEGEYHVGEDAPAGSTRLGIYYPRSGTLGGCSAHNAGASVIPQDSFWDYIADLTNDESWRPNIMRQYLIEFENNMYLEENDTGSDGHGFDGWLATSATDPEGSLANQTGRLAIMRSLATTLGYEEDELFDRMRTDVNSNSPRRDFQNGLFNFPFHNTPRGNRTNANILLDQVLADPANNLTIQLESLVTRILFDESDDEPYAMGVEYMRGRSLYRADPRSTQSSSNQSSPAPRQAYARKEVIISGGVFNTPQILKLSGIGPAEELESHGIRTIVDLSGVGTRLQDDYEISIAAYASVNLTGPPNPNTPACTLGVGDDPCVELWRQGTGPYAHAGATHATHLTSSVSIGGERDLVLWNPPDVFRGFFPGYSLPQGDPATTHTFAIAHAQGRNHEGGTVKLQSADPRDVPEIFFNFWAEGADEDLQALYEAIEFAREVYSDVDEPVGPFTEFQPCQGLVGTNCTEEATKDFIRRQIYSHHASSSAAIGADGDPMAVLDGRFRVRGVKGLRVVDGSALPRVPSPFPIIGQFMASYKAADAIIEDAAA